jgi:triacylglycerol lipase
MTQVLSPPQAAAIASEVYKLHPADLSELRATQQSLGCEGLFEVRDDRQIKAASGMLRWKQISRFGYLAGGVRGTPFADDILIATRGTLGAKTGPDWLSNYNIGVELGPSGLPVHAGFHRIWKTFSIELAAFVRGRNVRRVHCVGHSLGGALATLSADHLSRMGIGVALYTFGAPRVGDVVCSRVVTQRIGADNIHRVYHSSDPVPMIPLFPFWHMPFGQAGMAVANDLSGLVNADAHAMEASYRSAVASFASWDDLRAAAAARADQAGQTRTWLEQVAQGRGGFVMGSAKLLSMIGRALEWLLKKSGQLMANGFGAALVGTATVLDRIAWTLLQGAQLSREIARHVQTLIAAIWGWLGRATVRTAEITTAFLRWVLELMFQSLRSTAHRAIELLR